MASRLSETQQRDLWALQAAARGGCGLRTRGWAVDWEWGWAVDGEGGGQQTRGGGGLWTGGGEYV